MDMKTLTMEELQGVNGGEIRKWSYQIVNAEGSWTVTCTYDTKTGHRTRIAEHNVTGEKWDMLR